MSTEELAKRLDELSKAVTQGPEGWHREFTMRIPAEPKRDADLVLQSAAARLRDQERWIEVYQEELRYWVDLYAAALSRAETLEAENRELKAELTKHQESEFHPDWSLLEATRNSLREHMAMVRERDSEIADLKELVATYDSMPFPCHHHMQPETWDAICAIIREHRAALEQKP